MVTIKVVRTRSCGGDSKIVDVLTTRDMDLAHKFIEKMMDYATNEQCDEISDRTPISGFQITIDL